MEYHKLNSLRVTCLILGVIIFAKDAAAIECYQCNSTHERTCAEALPQHHSLYSFPCNHLQEPRYCVKMTGMFEANCLDCYQCSSSEDAFCPEQFYAGYHQGREAAFEPESCSHVFEARYCVKTTGMFEGELGTKRFCSARDWGNFCEWVQRPGDEREYRACVYTCGLNGCNGATTLALSSVLLMLLVPSIYLCRVALMS
ncbi:UPAR/Ly6 domain-containing protein bou [Penaeus vannamei]|uniref:UPAR/Ly6 domain-containing protein bou n=1 Tax=Penaeus vannamei TaxID=6689 RepID=UPI00387F769A